MALILVGVSASHAEGRGFAPRQYHNKDIIKMVQIASLPDTHELGGSIKGRIVCGTIFALNTVGFH